MLEARVCGRVCLGVCFRVGVGVSVSVFRRRSDARLRGNAKSPTPHPPNSLVSFFVAGEKPERRLLTLMLCDL